MNSYSDELLNQGSDEEDDNEDSLTEDEDLDANNHQDDDQVHNGRNLQFTSSSSNPAAEQSVTVEKTFNLSPETSYNNRS